jgi:hypothetical protein
VQAAGRRSGDTCAKPPARGVQHGAAACVACPAPSREIGHSDRDRGERALYVPSLRDGHCICAGRRLVYAPRDSNPEPNDQEVFEAQRCASSPLASNSVGEPGATLPLLSGVDESLSLRAPREHRRAHIACGFRGAWVWPRGCASLRPRGRCACRAASVGVGTARPRVTIAVAGRSAPGRSPLLPEACRR